MSMKEAISISGTLLMLDDKTPHVAVPVQAIRDGKVVATVLSDGGGKYRFTNLEQGTYQLRCQVLGGYAYYRATDSALRFTFYDSQKTKSTTNMADALRVQNGKTLKNIDFRFAPFKKGTWKTFTILDGLVHNAVTDIYPAPNGLMWFATRGGGISRYDGNQFLNFTTEDGLTSNYARSICGGSDDVIWFTTTVGGVSQYDGNQFVSFTTQDGLADDIVLSAHRDPDGVMWFGTDGAGVSRYDGNQFVNFTTQDGLAGDKVLSIDCFVGFDTRSLSRIRGTQSTASALNLAPRNESDSVMWFGTGSGVSRYDGKTFINFTTQDGLAGNTVTSIYGDPDGVMWFGTGGDGVSRYDGKAFVNFTTQDGLVDDNVRCIYRDPDGAMWFGTFDGVSRYDGKTFVNFTTADGLASNWVNAIYRDPEGVMWFGTEEGGVSRYDGEVFINFTTKDGLADNIVRPIHGASDGVMWFGTINGISRYDGKQFLNFTTQDGLADNEVWAIDCFVPRNDADGVMWFATKDGVSRYDGQVFTNFTTQDGLADNCVWSLHRAPDGLMWFGTDGGGVSRYDFDTQATQSKDGKTFVNFTDQDGLANNYIRTINHDSDGMMWFGTLGGGCGVSRYDGETFVNFTIQDGLAGNPVPTIYRDDDGVLWFGTGSGVSRYDFDTQAVGLSSPKGISKPTQSKDGKRFINLTVKDGLAYNYVLAIHRSSDGMMWFGTWGGGVSRYDGIAWTSLDTRDGLAGNDVSSIYQDSDGYLWFATDGGVTRYRPSTTPPRVRILSVKMNEKYAELEAIPSVTVGAHVAMEYSAIGFKTVPEKRQYRCRIREIDSDWRKPTKATSFDYTFDKPGTYTFEVQAIDRDLNYSEPATLSLTIEPDPVLVSMRTELNHLRREVRGKYHFENIIGKSIKMREVRALMEIAIDSGFTVLITGGTGTGKELVAKAIHYNSPRKDHPLMDRNCGAIPTELLASDLFGHRKGAFTGAQEDKVGLFEAASDGTVLLDEISEMPLDAQVHLLRVLEERKVQRLGENVSRDVDVRIIAMTNKDLIEEGKAGRFREDLYYRLTEFPIHIPPLRERPEDIPLLAEHFLQEYSQEQKKKLDSFVPGVFEMLKSYAWPGNVRELRNDIRRAAALVEEGERIHIHHFPPKITQEILPIQEAMQTIGQKSTRYRELVDDFERRCIEHALRVCNGNRSQAAKMLGLGRKSLYEKMQRLGIDISMLLPEK